MSESEAVATRLRLLAEQLIDSADARDDPEGYLALAGALGEMAAVLRRKTGFDIPVADWLRTDLRDLLVGYVLDDVSQRRGPFDQTAVARTISQHNEGKRHWSNCL